MMGITGVGSDIAADPCWDLSEELRSAMTIDSRSTQCKCMGLNLLHRESCEFPGLGVFYNEAVDEPPPVEPAELREPPPEPVLPTPPPEPEDQTDNVAMAAYFSELKEYQETVDRIQSGYKAQVDAYQAEADIYAAEVAAYQKDRFNWEINRAAAIKPAEASIELAVKVFDWAFINKEDRSQYWFRLGVAWSAQVVIIGILFFGILLMMKRKDVI